MIRRIDAPPQRTPEEIEQIKELLAASLVDSDALGRDFIYWKKYVDENSHDARKFFGSNAQGLQEYNQMIKYYSMDSAREKILDKYPPNRLPHKKYN